MSNQTPLAPHLSAFLQEHMLRERQVSIHTGDTYSYAFQLLLRFASQRRHRKPSALYLEDLDAALVLEFLRYLETQRGNSARTRNARLAAIKSFFRFVEYRVPSCIDQARRIHGIPTKRTDEALVGYLSHDEMQAVLNAPDPKTSDGIRDRAMLHLAFAGGLRVSELVGLRLDQLCLQPHCSIHVRGKGRRERILPLWKETAMALRAWLAVRGTWSEPELFLNARHGPLTRSGFEYILSKHVHTATAKQPSLAKKRVSPHVLRHTCAMRTLQATGDIRKVALWLGHASTQSTEVYVRADPSEKLEALVTITPPTLRRGRFTPPDKLLALLRPEKR
jgi:integrase/recombinase XerD